MTTGISAVETCLPPPWLAAAWAHVPEIRELEVEGALLRYRGWGLDAVDKPGLVFIHGFRAHARWWDHVAPYFTAHYRVIAPDLSGMGDSEGRASYSRRQFAREILAAAEHAGLAQMTLIGHSFGAVVAMFACKFAPEEVRRAIIIDNRVFADGLDAPPIPLVSERYWPDFEEAKRRFRLIPPGEWPDPHLLDYIARHSLRETPRGWIWKFDREAVAFTETGAFQDEIRNLTVPIDFVYGAQSELVGAEEVEAMLRNLPSCGRPVRIPAAHHHVMIEQPLAVIAALDGLLANDRRC